MAHLTLHLVVHSCSPRTLISLTHPTTATVPPPSSLLQTKTDANDSLPPPQYCWGGKVVSLATASVLNPFKAAAVCHPAMVEPKDAAVIKVPFIMLASGEEPADKVKEFEKKLEGPKHVEIFEDQVHGFMAARGDLSKERTKNEYIRGYKTILEFFGKHWP